MADYTENYNLKKPSPEDFVNIADINGNMDLIDEALKTHTHDTATTTKNGFMSAGQVRQLSTKANKTELEDHANNNGVHVTAAEKESWNGKADGAHTHEVATTTKDGFMTSAQVGQLNNAASKDLSNVEDNILKEKVIRAGFESRPPLIKFTRTPSEDYAEYAVYVGTYLDGLNTQIPNSFYAQVDAINPRLKDAVLLLNGIGLSVRKRDALDPNILHATATTKGNAIYQNQKDNNFYLPVNDAFLVTVSNYGAIMESEITTSIPGLNIELLPSNELQKEKAALLRLLGDNGGTFALYGEHNPPAVIGMYTGDGTDDRIIDLGFKPTATIHKLLYIKNGVFCPYAGSSLYNSIYVGGFDAIYGADETSGEPIIQHVSNGLKVRNYAKSGAAQVNAAGKQFMYIVWK